MQETANAAPDRWRVRRLVNALAWAVARCAVLVPENGFTTMSGELLQRITVNSVQCGGRPCIRGMRIRVTDILDLLAAGETQSEILLLVREVCQVRCDEEAR